MRLSRARVLLAVVLACLAFWPAQAETVVFPYLQNLTLDSVDLYWVSSSGAPARVDWLGRSARSIPQKVESLDYNPEEQLKAGPRYLHRAHLDGLAPGKTVPYTVTLEDQVYRASFQTMPGPRQSVRLIVYGDSETEPESTGKMAPWPTAGEPDRTYLVDQTTGYAANLKVIEARQPNAVLLAGDLVEAGGEQRDWDEFWKQNRRLSGQTLFLPVLGNHEYYGGPRNGGYRPAASKTARNKYLTYFHPRGPDAENRYYSQRLGPVRVIALDSCDGTPHKSEGDPNYYLDAAPEEAPGIGPDSPQYPWLRRELVQAQKDEAFTCVVFHHCPYSSGPHGAPPGQNPGQDTQSGRPLRVWTPIFLRYGVDAVFTGHDEMLERSEVSGTEITPEGKPVAHVVHFYDVGIGGDGLRTAVVDNPDRKFLAETDSPEVWEKGVLKDGGRHYGHLEVEVTPTADGWQATLTPVYVFPRKTPTGWTFERRVYPDVITLTAAVTGGELSLEAYLETVGGVLQETVAIKSMVNLPQLKALEEQLTTEAVDLLESVRRSVDDFAEACERMLLYDGSTFRPAEEGFTMAQCAVGEMEATEVEAEALEQDYS